MNRIEHITHHGKPYVAIPEATYLKLMQAVEDASDIAAVNEAMAALAAGTEETFSLAMANGLAEATTVGARLTIWREHRGHSKASLGRAVGVSGQFISQIEAGDRKGTAAIFRKLADALHCSVDDLL